MEIVFIFSFVEDFYQIFSHITNKINALALIYKKKIFFQLISEDGNNSYIFIS